MTPMYRGQYIDWEQVPDNGSTGKGSTKIERNLYAALARLHIRYVEQMPLANYIMDAYLPDYRLCIEADGCFYHCCPQCGYGDADHTYDVHRKMERRDWNFRRWNRIQTLRIWGHNLQTEQDAITAVQRVLSPYLAARPPAKASSE